MAREALWAGGWLLAATALAAAAEPSPWLDAVRTFADNALRHGRDRFGNTPLLADGVNVDTLEPVVWVHQKQEWVVSNLASQQILFRTLVGLSNLTAEPRYRKAAEDALRYHIEHLRSPCGLFMWGGHRFIDLRTLKAVGEQHSHEFKCSYPFYGFMWEVDRAATEKFLKAFWNAHILDWAVLDMNRHGRYVRPMGKLWDSEFRGAEPFFPGDGLTFINAGSDLVFAAAHLYRLSGDRGALAWAKRLAEQYVKARDPKTGLGAYQYSQARATADPAKAGTSSRGGDRAKNQLGPEFGPRALEGKVLDPGRAAVIYGRAAISQLRLAEALGDDGQDFLRWTRDGLLAFARHVYDPETNLLRPMFTDGTPIRPEDVKRPGYYRPEVFQPQAAGPTLLCSFALAWRLTADARLWETLRHMARHQGLGDLGAAPGQEAKPNLATDCADPEALFAVLELCRSAPAPADYRELAKAMGQNILRQRFHKGFFLPSPRHVNANFCTLEPHALLALEAALRDRPEAVPTYDGGRGYIHGPHDGMGRTYDSRAIWSRTR